MGARCGKQTAVYDQGDDFVDEHDLPKGFFSLRADAAECKIRFQDKSQGKGGNYPKIIGKYCFIVKDRDIVGVFSAESERERDEWIRVVKSAISGVRHVLKPPNPSIANCDDKSASQKKSARGGRGTSKGSVEVDMPRKMGQLKKKAIGGTFGIKSVKNRYFKLDGGELCYFADEDMRPTKLKGHINLHNAKVVPDNNNLGIVLKLEDGSLLEMEAVSAKLATEWNDVLRITINNLGGGAKAGKKRRVNLTNEGTDTGSSASASAASVDIIKSALKTHFLLGNITDFQPLVDALLFELALPGDVVIHQGTKGDLFYILESGTADVEKDGNAVGKYNCACVYVKQITMCSCYRITQWG